MPVREKQKARGRPPIALPREDIDRLSDLAAVAKRAMPEVADYLEEELERARAIPAGKPSEHVVKMGSRVDYRDEATGAVHTVTLVYPAESDIGRGLVSVLTPIGAALVGLTAGQTIEWTTRTGETRQLTVLSVDNGGGAELTERDLRDPA